MQGAEEGRLRRMNNTPQGEAIDGNAADDILMVNQALGKHRQVQIGVAAPEYQSEQGIAAQQDRQHIGNPGLIDFLDGRTGLLELFGVSLQQAAIPQIVNPQPSTWKMSLTPIGTPKSFGLASGSGYRVVSSSS